MARRRDESDDDDERSHSGEDSEEGSASSEDESGGEEASDGEDDAVSTAGTEAKHLFVEQDLVAIKNMMEGMDKIKMRLQFRIGLERNDGASSNPVRRRASVEDIVVPASTTAGVQTTWDMQRMFEVEKIVSAADPPHETVASSVKEKTAISSIRGVPAQLSIHDLARTFGIQDAIGGADGSMRAPPPTRASVLRTHQDEQLGLRESSHKHASGLWDGLTMRGSDLNPSRPATAEGSLDSHRGLNLEMKDSASTDISNRHLADSFGSPISPVHQSRGNGGLDDSSHPREEKTMEQREMEAVKELLFF